MTRNQFKRACSDLFCSLDIGYHGKSRNKRKDKLMCRRLARHRLNRRNWKSM